MTKSLFIWVFFIFYGSIFSLVKKKEKSIDSSYIIESTIQ